MTDFGRRIAADATGQRGYFTRQQATAGGATRAMLRSRVQSGNLQRAGVRTFTSPLLDRDCFDQLQALVLDVGDPVWVCGPTAAALYGFDGFTLRPPFHLLLTRDRYIHRVGNVFHSTRELALIDRGTAHGLAATTPTRTVIDLVRGHSTKQVTAALDSALRDGGTSEEFLHRRIVDLRRRGRAGIPALLEIIDGVEASRGGHSWLERRFLELISAAKLPKPETQVTLSRAGDRLIRVDCLFAQAGVVVELLGYRWHRTREQLQRDSERANRLTIDGWRMIQFTYDDVAQNDSQMIQVLGEILDSGQNLGRKST